MYLCVKLLCSNKDKKDKGKGGNVEDNEEDSGSDEEDNDDDNPAEVTVSIMFLQWIAETIISYIINAALSPIIALFICCNVIVFGIFSLTHMFLGKR